MQIYTTVWHECVSNALAVCTEIGGGTERIYQIASLLDERMESQLLIQIASMMYENTSKSFLASTLVSSIDTIINTSIRAINKSLFVAMSICVSCFSRIDLVLELRKRANLVVMGYYSEPYATLILSMIFGKGEKMDSKLEHSFKVIGMQHVVAASGYNVSLILSLATVIASRFRRFYRLLILGGCLFLYASMTDLGPPILRAVGMSSLCLLLKEVFFRQYQPLWCLGVVSLVMLVIEPALLTSVSFQLSVTATLGIGLFLPLVSSSVGDLTKSLLGETPKMSSQTAATSQWHFLTIIEVFKEAFLTTCAAQVLTLPLILYHFQELSLLSIPANTFLIWLTPLITTGGVIFLVVGVLFGWIGGAATFLVMAASYLLLPTGFFVWAVQQGGHLEMTLLKVPAFNWVWVVGWYGCVLLMWGWVMTRRFKHKATRTWFYESGQF